MMLRSFQRSGAPLLAVLTALGALGAPFPPSPAVAALTAARSNKLMSGRALWVKRDQLTSPERIVRFVDDAAENGFNVLFVQVRGRGDAWYGSKIVPRATLLAGSFNADGTPWDPLDHLLRRAHARNIEVHAWLNMMIAWSGEDPPRERDHVMNLHPGWLAVDARGRSLADYTPREIKRANIEGAFLASGNPEVREHLRDVVREIALNYEVDGIHLDYIRNPLVDTGYDQATRASFLAEHGVDPWKLRHAGSGLKARFGDHGLETLEKTWKEWRCAQVTRLVADIRSDLDGIGRPIVFSAAVFPNCKYAPSDVGQDWMAWCKQGLVDMVVPMFYSTDTGTVLKHLTLAQAELPLDVILYAGLAVYNQSLASVADKALRVQRAGAHGVCFFPYDTLAEKPGSLRKLARAAFGGSLAGLGSRDHGKPAR